MAGECAVQELQLSSDVYFMLLLLAHMLNMLKHLDLPHTTVRWAKSLANFFSIDWISHGNRSARFDGTDEKFLFSLSQPNLKCNKVTMTFKLTQFSWLKPINLFFHLKSHLSIKWALSARVGIDKVVKAKANWCESRSNIRYQLLKVRKRVCWHQLRRCS